MRVLIILAVVSVALAHEAVLTGTPLIHSATFLESPKSFEYSTAVHTADYTNFQAVRSDHAGLAIATVAAPELHSVEIKTLPEVHTVELKSVSTPIITTNHVIGGVEVKKVGLEVGPEPTVNIQTNLPLVSHTRLIEPSLHYTREFIEPASVVVPATPIVHHAVAPIVHHTVVEPIVHHAVTPIVHHAIAPVVHHTVEPIVHHTIEHVHHTAEPIVALRTAPIVHHLATPALTPVVESVVEHKVVGEAVVGSGILAEKSQYHSQNELGEAAYGHADFLQKHDAIQDAAGNKAGSFSYVSPDGRILRTDYVADENGYRVASNALPVHEHLRRRRSIAFSTAPLIKEATLTEVPTHLRFETLDHHIATPSVLAVDPLLGNHLLTRSSFIHPYAGLRTFSTLPTFARAATLTNIVHTPGHAISYRLD